MVRGLVEVIDGYVEVPFPMGRHRFWVGGSGVLEIFRTGRVLGVGVRQSTEEFDVRAIQ